MPAWNAHSARHVDLKHDIFFHVRQQLHCETGGAPKPGLGPTSWHRTGVEPAIRYCLWAIPNPNPSALGRLFCDFHISALQLSTIVYGLVEVEGGVLNLSAYDR